MDTYIHTYALTKVQPEFGSIGIVIGYAELRFRFDRIKNGYIATLHRYIHYQKLDTYIHTYVPAKVQP